MYNKAIFLDRDGVINHDVLNYTWKIEDFIFLPGVMEACREFLKQEFKIIVITNQAGIAKGMYTHDDVRKLHTHMIHTFQKEKIEIASVYYCPHFETYSKCLCRKPGSLLVEKALARFNIDPVKSYFIGDRERDIMAGNGAGVRGILVDVNDDLRKTIPQIL